MEDSRLIELVREHPCLFNAKHHLYKDANVRDNVWSEIGMKMKLPAEECKNRWKNIRDTYMRRKRAKKLPTGSASSKKVRKWHLEDYLEFMNVVECERETVTNTITQDDETKVDGQETENVEMAEESVYSEIRDPEDLNKDLSEEPEQLDGDGVPKQSKKRKLKTKLSGERESGAKPTDPAILSSWHHWRACARSTVDAATMTVRCSLVPSRYVLTL
ncbi:uncharacterized protein LOC124372993 [Homalodisca vitripennis]|uniref:uncharacterized protein LOC124372993 n=1 Tax=Homalodisca vitripennis TaxID=197043 RepID=UPI001EEB8E8C|nr:uncharacterized protein LOC124372993 [Homalodisca vitripennis]